MSHRILALLHMDAQDISPSPCPSATMTVPCCSRSSSCSCSGSTTPDSTKLGSVGSNEEEFASKLKTALWTMGLPPNEEDKPSLPGHSATLQDLPSKEKHHYLADYFKYTRAMAMREHDSDSQSSSTDSSPTSSPSLSRTSSSISASSRGETAQKEHIIAKEAYDADVESEEEEDAAPQLSGRTNPALFEKLCRILHGELQPDCDHYEYDISQVPSAPFLRSQSFPPELPPLDLPSTFLNLPIIELTFDGEDETILPTDQTLPIIKLNGMQIGSDDEYINAEDEEDEDEEVACPFEQNGSGLEEDSRYLLVPPASWRAPRPSVVTVAPTAPPSSMNERHLPTVPTDRNLTEDALAKALFANSVRHFVGVLLSGGNPDIRLLSADRVIDDLD